MFQCTQQSVARLPFAEHSVSQSDNRRGYSIGVLAVMAATALALILENWIQNTNLAMVYVVAVAVIGLRHGSRPAMVAVVCSFLCFNFFLTEPRYTFAVARREELATLLFLFLIAIICGSAASRIRRQLLLLQEANSYSEAMRSLGQALSVAENAEEVWLATAARLTSALQTETVVAVPGENNLCTIYPNLSQPLSPAVIAALESIQKGLNSPEHSTEAFSAAGWSIFPVVGESGCLAWALIRLAPKESLAASCNNDLIHSVLQQATNTWKRMLGKQAIKDPDCTCGLP